MPSSKRWLSQSDITNRMLDHVALYSVTAFANMNISRISKSGACMQRMMAFGVGHDYCIITDAQDVILRRYFRVDAVGLSQILKKPILGYCQFRESKVHFAAGMRGSSCNR